LRLKDLLHQVEWHDISYWSRDETKLIQLRTQMENSGLLDKEGLSFVFLDLMFLIIHPI
jgi:hypothetical protein